MTAAVCPVCNARFRGARLCSRCGADLSRLMHLAAAAWRLRTAARQSILASDFPTAHQQALQAQALHSTPNGEALRQLAAWLRAHQNTNPASATAEAAPAAAITP